MDWRWAAIHFAQLVLGLVVLAVWEWTSRTGLVSVTFVGRPSSIIRLLLDHLADGTFLSASKDTLAATFAAFAAGIAAALGTALALTVFPAMRLVLRPYLGALNSLPRIALIPLFIIWFGLGLNSKIAAGFSLMYFILLESTLAGAASVDRDHLQLAHSLGLSRTRRFLQIDVPTAVPAIFAGLRLGLIYTLLGVVSAELLAGGTGLGSLVAFYSNTFNANGVFAVLGVLVVISSTLAAVMTALERHLTRWRA